MASMVAEGAYRQEVPCVPCWKLQQVEIPWVVPQSGKASLNIWLASIGNGMLCFPELEEVVLGVEVALNNRPLNYLEDDVQLPVVTPNTMLHINPSHLPKLRSQHVSDKALCKRARYLSKWKDMLWNWWTREYVHTLREQHWRAGGEQTSHPNIGDVVAIQDKTKSRNHWKLWIVTALINGRDRVVRGAKVWTSKGSLERPIQQLNSLKLMNVTKPNYVLNPEAPEFSVRPRRDTAVGTTARIQEIAEQSERYMALYYCLFIEYQDIVWLVLASAVVDLNVLYRLGRWKLIFLLFSFRPVKEHNMYLLSEAYMGESVGDWAKCFVDCVWREVIDIRKL